MGADFLAALLRTNIAGSAAVLVVLLLRGPITRRFGAKTTYGLWIIAPLAMIASLLPLPAQAPVVAVPVEIVSSLTGATLPTGEASYVNLPLIIWATGLLATVATVLFAQLRFTRALGHPSLDAGGLPVLRACDGYRVGPAVVGIFNPKIVLPADFEQRYGPEERKVVLAHERAHLFGHDPLANAVCALLQCFCWFNPLAHIAAQSFRIDQELNADAAVMAEFPNHTRIYSEALLKGQIAALSLPLGCQWPSRSEHPLRRRIKLILSPRRSASGRLRALISLFLAGAVSAAAWATTPSLTAAPLSGRAVDIWTILKPTAGPPGNPTLTRATDGVWSDLYFSLSADRQYLVRINPTILADRSVDIRVTVTTGGDTTELPPIRLRAPEPGLIRLGEAALLVSAGAPP